MVRLTGFEPVTIRLEGGCSIQLSYRRINLRFLLIIKINNHPYHTNGYKDFPPILSEEVLSYKMPKTPTKKVTHVLFFSINY